MIEIQSPNIKIALLILAGGVVLALTLTLLIFLIFFAQDTSEKNNQNLSTLENALKTTDFMIDSPEPDWKGLEFIPFRTSQDQWTSPQVEAYFSPPEEILINIIEKKTEEAVDKLFEKVE